MSADLEIDLERQVHPGLRLRVRLSLGPECSVVFGPSGAGKTTLLRLIAGLERPDAGRVRVGDATLFDAAARINLPLRKRHIGMIFQDDLLFPHLSVADNLRFGLKGWNQREADARLTEVAALCSVEAFLKRRPATLSGGERQRVGLARAFAPRPRLLLCDEPVSAIDLAGRHALIERLRAVQRAEAIPTLYVTHSPAEAVAVGTRLFLLAGGTVVDEGPPLDVLARRSGARLEGVSNLFAARVEHQADDGGETVLRLDDGPALVVPRLDRPVGHRLTVELRADDVLLAHAPVVGLSARNIIAGTVDRVVASGAEAEVVVRTGGVCWIVSVVAPAVAALGLHPGGEVCLIVKARSCRVLE